MTKKQNGLLIEFRPELFGKTIGLLMEIIFQVVVTRDQVMEEMVA